MPGRILVDTTPLRESRDFRLLFIGQLISILGTQLTVVAIPYQVYSMTALLRCRWARSAWRSCSRSSPARWRPGRSATRSTGAAS